MDRIIQETHPEHRHIVLLGNPETKRTIFFLHAACEIGLHVHVLDWRAGWPRLWDPPALCELTEGWEQAETLIKIDPPVWESCRLEELDGLTGDYQKQLLALARCQEACRLQFFNHPRDILALLDKRGCKDTLSQAGLSITETVGGQEPIGNTDQLLAAMESERIYQVFIKPVHGSGAAGIAAFRFQPRTGQMVLYTCAVEEPSSKELVNTKRLRRFSHRQQIVSLLNRLLKLDCIVERWYAKAEQDGFSYDLRAVMQDGKLDFLLARLSKGPITNLHLNNHPLPAEALKLPQTVIETITVLCRNAMECYPGLKSAGIDLLLEKGSLRPRIIEMNGQGDLIYQDIYHENRIYLHQAEMMKQWMEKATNLMKWSIYND
ncbi:MAG: STM4014 family protein [Lachnospiraceae bacterium]|nr:STM4014 family protein [Lachnospiraceae bacterium]